MSTTARDHRAHITCAFCQMCACNTARARISRTTGACYPPAVCNLSSPPPPQQHIAADVAVADGVTNCAANKSRLNDARRRRCTSVPMAAALRTKRSTKSAAFAGILIACKIAICQHKCSARFSRQPGRLGQCARAQTCVVYHTVHSHTTTHSMHSCQSL